MLPLTIARNSKGSTSRVEAANQRHRVRCIPDLRGPGRGARRSVTTIRLPVDRGHCDRLVFPVRDSGGRAMAEGRGAAVGPLHRAARAGDVHDHSGDRQISVYVDQRVRVTEVSAESALTRDTVPVNVDAIVFWMVWNAEKSILEVVGFQRGHHDERADGAAGIDWPARSGADDHRARDAGPGAAAYSGREDQSVGHHRAIGGDPRCAHPAGARRRHVAAGAGRAGTAGAHHPGHGGDGDRSQIRRGSDGVHQQSGGAASARDEHAVRGHQGEGRDGDCAFERGGNHGLGRAAGTASLSRQKQ